MTEEIWTGLSPAQADGLACVVCAADYLSVRVARRPVGRSETGSQVLACKGRCVEIVNDPTGSLPPWWAERLAVLLDALGDVPVAPFERASLAILARQELTTVLHLADLLRRCRQSVLRGEQP